MRRYKVLHITNFLDMSGAQENTLYTVTHLDQERFEAHLAANLWGKGRKLDSVLARRAQSIPHIVIHDLPHIRFMPNPIYDPWALWDMIRLMRDERFDIVHTHANKVGIMARIAAKISGIPIIIQGVHGWSFQYTLIPKAVNYIFLLMEKFASRFTDHFVTVSEVLVRDGLRHNLGKADQYSVVRSGMELKRFLEVEIDETSFRRSLGIPASRLIVGTVMLFYRRKSPESIVRIAPKILEAVPDTHFLLVGDGDMMPTVKALVEEMDLEDCVTLTGLRNDPEKLMALMDVFVHPALVEILPRVIIQAQATGTPVVSTELGGIPEVINDRVNGFLVPAGDLDALTESIIELLKDPALRTKIGRAAQASTSSAFTVEAMVSSIEQLYDDLIESRLNLSSVTGARKST